MTQEEGFPLVPVPRNGGFAAKTGSPELVLRNNDLFIYKSKPVYLLSRGLCNRNVSMVY